MLSIRLGYHIARVLHAIRRERNGVWHTEAASKYVYDFEKQQAVRLNLIWFRATQALIDAAMVEAGFANADGPLGLAVLAIEAWLGAIKENDARDPDVASATNSWWATALMCSRGLLTKRHNAGWRDYFNDSGGFVIPDRTPAVV